MENPHKSLTCKQQGTTYLLAMKEKENLVKVDTYLNDGPNIFFHVREREEGNEYLKRITVMWRIRPLEL